MKVEFYCSDCGVEAVIEITDDPWDTKFDDLQDNVCCFSCGDDGVKITLIEE